MLPQASSTLPVVEADQKQQHFLKPGSIFEVKGYADVVNAVTLDDEEQPYLDN